MQTVMDPEVAYELDRKMCENCPVLASAPELVEYMLRMRGYPGDVSTIAINTNTLSMIQQEIERAVELKQIPTIFLMTHGYISKPGVPAVPELEIGGLGGPDTPLSTILRKFWNAVGPAGHVDVFATSCYIPTGHDVLKYWNFGDRIRFVSYGGASSNSVYQFNEMIHAVMSVWTSTKDISSRDLSNYNMWTPEKASKIRISGTEPRSVVD